MRWEYTDNSYYQGVCSAEGVDLKLTLTSDLRLGFEGGQANARTLLKRVTSAMSRCPGAGPCRRRTTPTPTSARSGPPTTGSTGWPADSSPIIPGAATCSAARLRSRG